MDLDKVLSRVTGSPPSRGGDKEAVLTRIYPLAHRHGSFPLAAFLTGDLEPLLQLGEGLGLTRARPGELAFLDTETTGLVGGAGCLVFLVGIGFFAGGAFHLEQHLLLDPAEEEPFLQRIEARLAAFPGVVTFFGRSFDRPRLEDRFSLHGLPFRVPDCPHLDLHPLARRLWGDRLPDLRLTTLERYVLGVERRGDLPGRLAPVAYRRFLAGDPGWLAGVVHHNRRDLLSLVTLAEAVRREAVRPASLRARLHRARALAARGEVAQAAAFLEEGVGAAPGDPLAETALVAAGRLLQRAGAPAAAAALWERWAGWGYPQVLVALAKHYEHRVRDYRRALALTEEALTRAPWKERPALGQRAERLRRKLRQRGPRSEGR